MNTGISYCCGHTDRVHSSEATETGVYTHSTRNCGVWTPLGSYTFGIEQCFCHKNLGLDIPGAMDIGEWKLLRWMYWGKTTSGISQAEL